ncbi:MAG: hypothetical protein QOK43_931 [Acidimicrobiaceae bacterium]|nr:hypothetical protein [Acidimicrobiaceae bacterium]
MSDTLSTTVRRWARRPWRVLRLVTSSRARQSAAYALRRPRRELRAERGLHVRQYRSYDEYVSHQAGKLDMVDLRDYDVRFRAALAERLKGRGFEGRSVLCLAARLGTEVRAFHDAGAFAVGIDLNPGKDNQWVVKGDFHNLVFPDDSVDVAYSNSLDHAFDLAKTLSQVHRVLKPGGTLIVDAQAGAQTGDWDDWAATAWQDVDDLVAEIGTHGFEVVSRTPITEPQNGEEVVFKADKAGE